MGAELRFADGMNKGTKLAQRSLGMLVALAILALSLGAAAEDRYKVVRIPVNHGDTGLPRALNIYGQVVGSSGEPHGGDSAAFFAQRGGRGLRLATLAGGDYSEGFAINDLGDVVGSSNTSSSVRAVRWRNGAVTTLAMPPKYSGSEALSLNDSGTAAGYVSGIAGMHAAKWASDGTVQLLGNLERGQSSQAAAIDYAGDVAGWVETNGVTRAFLWTAATGMSLLPGGASSKANGMNDLRQVVGSCAGVEGDRACLWTSPATSENLGTLPGGDHGEAFDINNAGTVVGAAGTSMGLRAFVWTRSEGMLDLNSLIPPSSGIILSAAVAINERGEILAYGGVNHDLEQDRNVDMDHGVHAGPTFVFLLTPTR